MTTTSVLTVRRTNDIMSCDIVSCRGCRAYACWFLPCCNAERY